VSACGMGFLEVVVRTEQQWFGHPRGLTVLLLTEMWAVFSYYGMRTLLMYYMINGLEMPQGRASIIYGSYTAAFYLTPIFGGAIADRWLGRRLAVVAGGSLMAIGHFMMGSERLFFPALATIALGNGLFLPSLPSQINALYDDADHRRTTAYNVYYVGINVGGFLAPLVCGTLGERVGWHWGFGIAGAGMVVGLVTYIAGARFLIPDGAHLRRPGIVSSAVDKQRGPRRIVGLLVGIAATVILFRGAYEQVGNTVAVWIDADVDRYVGWGWSIPRTWFQSLNPLLIFILSPVFLAYWSRASRRGADLAPAAKMAVGAATVSASFLMLSAVAALCRVYACPVSWVWVLMFFIILSAGELYILPVGLALFSRLAPPGFVATTVAAWFMTGFGGNLLAGGVGSLWSSMSHSQFFAIIAMIAFASAALLFALRGPAASVEQASECCLGQ
jgi:proton-dependent oligopeptide transporter, POT family